MRRHPTPLTDPSSHRPPGPRTERRPGPHTSDGPIPLEGFGRKYVPPRRRVLTVAAGAVFGAMIGIPLIPYIDRLKNGQPQPAPDASLGLTSDQASATGPTATGSPVDSPAVHLEPPATGPYILASFHGGALHLAGTVPDTGTSNAVLDAAQLTYAPLVSSELAVDDQLGPVDWLATAPQIITLLSLATSSTALLAEGQIRLVIQAPTTPAAERIEVALADASGLAVITEHVDITNLLPPLLEITGTVHQLALNGRVPTQDIQANTLAAAVDVYGRGNVTSQITVDDTVHPALWMYNPHGLFEALFVFPEIEIQLNAETTTGFVRGGYHFEPDSADPIPTNPAVINFAVNLMTRDPSLLMLIEAHTDTDGPDTANQGLSQQRADTVASYYTDAGINPERITAVGKGETNPLTQDTTPDGKARNRRIEVKLSTLAGN